MGTIQMSQQEVSRLEIVQRVKNKQLKQCKAAKMLKIGIRQVKRLVRAYRQQGALGLVSRKRDKPGNRRTPEARRLQAVDLIRTHYSDFGPLLAQEQLEERHGLRFSVETVRQWMMGDGLWVAKKAPKAVIKQMRERRACWGELVQADGSPHDWFEGRGASCTLLVFIDDATSQVMWLQFVESETTFAYMNALRSYLKQYGKPLSLYTDKLGVFRVNHPSPASGTGRTQFGRACDELGIELLAANSPQAKGRVERVNQTLQDRLIKAMRLAGINNAEQGNVFLPSYLAKHNPKFAVVPKDLRDAHRVVTETELELDFILCWKEVRTLSKNLEFSFNSLLYQIQTQGHGYRLRHSKVTVCELPTGVVRVFREGKELLYKTYTRQQRVVEVVGAKELNRVLDWRLPKPYSPHATHPWKRWNPNTKASRERAVVG